jgi:hypothetical protein
MKSWREINMKTKKEYVIADGENAWVSRWKDEPTQYLRFLTDPIYAKLHAGQYYTLVCQEEVELECRLCFGGKARSESGFAFVEKDQDGVVRLFKAGPKQFWQPFLKEHDDDMKLGQFRIKYHASYRPAPYMWERDSDESGAAFATEDELLERLRGLATDEVYGQFSVKQLPHQKGEMRRSRGGEEDERGDSEIEINDPSV